MKGDVPLARLQRGTFFRGGFIYGVLTTNIYFTQYKICIQNIENKMWYINHVNVEMRQRHVSPCRSRQALRPMKL